jgi:hypothetical protein
MTRGRRPRTGKGKMMDRNGSDKIKKFGMVSGRRGLLIAVLSFLPLLLRLGYIAEVEDQFLYQVLVEDELSYDTQAREIAAGDVLGDLADEDEHRAQGGGAVRSI